MTSLEPEESGEENVAEEECTMEFGEEPYVESQSTFIGPRYCEYAGEDYSMYLNETTDPPPSPHHTADVRLQPPSVRRYVKNKGMGTFGKSSRAQKRYEPSSTPATVASPSSRTDSSDIVTTELRAGGDDTEPHLIGFYDQVPIFPPPPPQVNRTRRMSIDSVRERFEQFLTIGRSAGRRKSGSVDSRPAIHEFTFADSKMGSMMLAAESTSADTSRQTWWDIGMLSTRSDSASSSTSSKTHRQPLQRRRRRRPERSNSEPDLAALDHNEGPSVAGGNSTSFDPVSATSTTQRPVIAQPGSGRSGADEGHNKGYGDKRASSLFRRVVDSVGGYHTRRIKRPMTPSPDVEALQYCRTYDEIPVRP